MATSAYAELAFPDPPADRPTVLINMVSTIDGKILTGDREEHVMDLGSEDDHATMRFLQAQCDGVMLGAGSLRATPGLWYPAQLARFVVSGSGALPESRFFTDAPERAYVVTYHESAIASEIGMEEQASDELVRGVRVAQLGTRITGHSTVLNLLSAGAITVDFAAIFAYLRVELGIGRLLIEGGSELNSQLLALGLVDELFLTLAPKVKLGRDVPTIADGDPLDRRDVQRWRLLSAIQREDELFLRYRRR